MSRHTRSSGQEPAMSLGECQAALAAAQQEVAELRDKYLRAVAASENARKQSDRDANVRIADRLRRFSLRLIEVADNLERALAHAPQGDALRPGVQATLQQLQAAFRQEGIIPILVEPGALFDPRYHEAIGGHPADVAHDTVAEVVQTGYTFNGQVLQPARVMVATPARAQR